MGPYPRLPLRFGLESPFYHKGRRLRSPDLESVSSNLPKHLVALRPPLPCIDASRGPGFVHGLAADRMIIEWQKSAPYPEKSPSDLTVALSSARSFRFESLTHTIAAPGPAGQPWAEAKTTSTNDLGRLADLLNLVRKGQHIALCESTDVEATDRYTGFSDLTLRPVALPDLAWHELDTSRKFLGYTAALPLLVTGMTGGLERGAEINRRLAKAAEAFGIPMGVGSQRVALENPEHAAIFAVKQYAPRLFLIANIGISQLRSKAALDDCRRAVEMIDADALAVHVNVLQEVIQVEGDRDFRGVIDQLAAVTAKLGVPVMVKEVGCGIDPTTGRRLAAAGVQAIDCGGKGGTSWGFIEGLRADSRVTRAVADTFRDFGIPTAMAALALRRALPGLDLVATGGIRDGLTVAKAMAVGATLSGIGLPLLRAALAGEDEPHVVLETLAQGLKTAMICTGSRDLNQLRGRLTIQPEFEAALQGMVDGN